MICPSTHPYRIPQLTVIIAWSHNGEADFSQWYLSSDQGHGAPAATYDGGLTFHTDWFGGWDPDIQDIWNEEHLGIGTTIDQMQTSSAGILCRDDKQLDTAQRPLNNGRIANGFASDAWLPEEIRYSDIPDPPMEHGPGHMSYFGFPLLTMRA